MNMKMPAFTAGALLLALLQPTAGGARGADPREPPGKPRAVLLVDISRSMVLDAHRQPKAVAAARRVCDHLGQVTLVKFAGAAEVVPDATGERRRQQIAELGGGLGTSFIAAIDATAGVDNSCPAILLTDGGESFQHDGVVDYYRRCGRTVLVVGVEPDCDAADFMKELAAATGGRYFDVDELENLLKLLTGGPGLRLDPGEGPLAAGLPHRVRVELFEAGNVPASAWFACHSVDRYAVAGEVRLLDGRGKLLDRWPLPPPTHGPASEVTVTLPDRSGPYALEARVRLGKFTAEARANILAERVCGALLPPARHLGTLDGGRLQASVPLATDDSLPLDYLLTVTDFSEAGGRVLTLNFAKQAGLAGVKEGAAEAGRKWPPENAEVLGPHAEGRLRGPGQITLVVGRFGWQGDVAPGLYKATLTVALKGAPQRRCSTALTLTVPEPPARGEASVLPPALALRSQTGLQPDGDLTRLRRELESERKAWAEEQRLAEERAAGTDRDLAERSSRNRCLLVALVLLTLLAYFGGVFLVKRWLYPQPRTRVRPPRRDPARPAVPPPAPAETPGEEILPTFDADAPDEEA
jgi:hypothetical protein